MSAKKVYEMKMVERVVREGKRVVAGVELVLTPEQAITLRTILQHIDGDPKDTIRGHAGEIENLLYRAGIPYIPTRNYSSGALPAPRTCSVDESSGIYFMPPSKALLQAELEKLK